LQPPTQRATNTEVATSVYLKKALEEGVGSGIFLGFPSAGTAGRRPDPEINR
jgi:hypothetical protein